MNVQNFRGLLRNFKNSFTNGYDEKVMLELDYARGRFYRMASIEQAVDLSTLASGTVALSTQLPANARVLFAGLYVTSAVTLPTATNALVIGLGSGTSTAFYTSPAGASLALATSEMKPVADTVARAGGTVASNVVLAVVKSDGTTPGANNTGTGIARVNLIYDYVQLPNA